MRVNKEQPIHWCQSKPAKQNPMQLKRKAIGPAGQVVEISLANGKAITNTIGNTYKQMIEHEKARRDWVWYDSLGDNEREALIEARQTAHAQSQVDYARLFETKLDKLAEVLERSMVGGVKPTVSQEQLAEVMTAQPKERKSK